MVVEVARLPSRTDLLVTPIWLDFPVLVLLWFVLEIKDAEGVEWAPVSDVAVPKGTLFEPVLLGYDVDYPALLGLFSLFIKRFAVAAVVPPVYAFY